MEQHDIVVIGAGAAGMMCAAVAGARGRDVLLIDHGRAPGEKIRISGGWRCNFTNREVSHRHFLSDNPQFCISALKRYTPQDFIALLEHHAIAWHEKTRGQLFCDGSATQVVAMLRAELLKAGVTLRLSQQVTAAHKTQEGFLLCFADGARVACGALVVATGGKSIPKMGASDLGYRLAAQFGVAVTLTRPALMPLTLGDGLQQTFAPLAGVALDARIRCGKTLFADALLFTHRGLSGPAILQISSGWREGDALHIDLLPGHDALELLRRARAENGRQAVHTVLATLLPRRLAKQIADSADCGGTLDHLPDARPRALGDLPDARLRALAARPQHWRIVPSGTEGYRVAEVTAGGIDTRALDSRSMQVKAVPGLYFIGEVVDVTGWLGGYNFQWAWSSGWCAGQAI